MKTALAILIIFGTFSEIVISDDNIYGPGGVNYGPNPTEAQMQNLLNPQMQSSSTNCSVDCCKNLVNPDIEEEFIRLGWSTNEPIKIKQKEIPALSEEDEKKIELVRRQAEESGSLQTNHNIPAQTEKTVIIQKPNE